jgi:hypothetical protein
VPYGADRPDVLGNPKLPSDRPKDQVLARYFDTSKYVANQLGQFGNSGRNTLIGPGQVAWDATLSKRFPLWSEKRSMQVRWDVFNILNRANFNNPNGNLGSGRTFGTINSAGAGRIMQLALRLEF